MDRISITTETVRAGQTIGTLGESGTDCAHLHLVLYKNLDEPAIDRLEQGRSPSRLTGSATKYAAPFDVNAKLVDMSAIISMVLAEDVESVRSMFYGAIAYDRFDGSWGWGSGSTERVLAENRALAECGIFSDNCSLVASFSDSCAALAADDLGTFVVVTSSSRSIAETTAEAQCDSISSDFFLCDVLISVCTDFPFVE